MTTGELRQRVEARDHLADAAESVGRRFESEALAALRSGDAAAVQAAVQRGARSVESLAETLRVYQAELHAQADELQLAQARTEEALARFTALFANLPVAAMLVRDNGEVADANAAAQQLFGVRSSAGAHRFLHRLVEPRQYQDVVRPAFHQARAAGAARCDEVEFVSAPGRRFWGELHVAALPAAATSRQTFACVVVDRSDHRELLRRVQEANHQLAASEALLAESTRLAHLGGWEYDVSTGRLCWSAQARAIHEFDGEAETTLDAALACYAPASRPLLEAAFHAALAHGEDFDLELDLVTARGQPLRVRTVGHAELRDGRCMRVTGVVQDVTLQHRARQAIDSLTQRLNLAREAGGIGVWDCDLAQGRVYVDEGTRALLEVPEMPPDTGFGDLLAPALEPGERSRLDAALQAALDGAPLSIELRLAPAQGGARWLHLAGRAERDAAGRPTRLIGCAWDTTAEHVAAELAAAKQTAEAANQAKNAFLSRMSHELRTPLNAILGFAQLMRIEAENGDLTVKPQRVQLIETSARHLLALINEVLDISGIESGQLRLDLRPVPLADVLRECLPLLEATAAARSVTLDCSAAAAGDAAPTVRADRLRLKQVLLNLLSNAIKYNREGGRVHVDARVDGARVLVDIADTGRGLTPQQRADLFQPFNRAGAEASRIEGTGMGLYVCRRFAEAMGGTVEVASAPDVGSTFTLTLPAAGEAAAGER